MSCDAFKALDQDRHKFIKLATTSFYTELEILHLLIIYGNNVCRIICYLLQSIEIFNKVLNNMKP